MHLRTLVAIVALCATGCGYTIKTTIDYDRTVNFGDYSTFFMMQGSSSGDPLLDQRAAHDVRLVLTAKGLKEVSEGEGRAAVVVHAATNTKHTDETFYDGWGGAWRWRWAGPGTATTFVEDYTVGTVVVDIFDAQTKQAIWRGVATDALSVPAERDASITKKAITRMFATFPPGEAAR